MYFDWEIIKNLEFRKENVDKEITDIELESEKFREINFSYPQWQPNAKQNSESKVPVLRQKYEELGYNEKKNLLSLSYLKTHHITQKKQSISKSHTHTILKTIIHINTTTHYKIILWNNHIIKSE